MLLKRVNQNFEFVELMGGGGGEQGRINTELKNERGRGRTTSATGHNSDARKSIYSVLKKRKGGSDAGSGERRREEREKET